MKNAPRRGYYVRWPAMWLLAILMTLTVGSTVISTAADWRVRQEANTNAVSYANVLGSTVHGLPRFFETGWLSWGSVYDLRRVLSIGDVFFFRLFDADGRLLLLSSDIKNDDIDWTWTNLREHHGASAGHILDNRVLRGEPQAQLKQWDGRTLRAEFVDSGRSPRYYSTAFVPFSVNNELLGVIEVFVDQSSRHDAITQDYIRIGLVGALSLAALALLGFLHWRSVQQERQVIEEQANFLARYDPLTGGLNRASFNQAVAESALDFARGKGEPGILYLDLDNFKSVNDRYGNETGDEVLRQARIRLTRLLPSRDCVARLAGDRFAVLMSGAGQDGAARVETLAESARRMLNAPYSIAGSNLHCGVSIGGAVMTADTRDAQHLSRCAELALASAKQGGGDRFVAYTPALEQASAAREQMIEDLKRALRDESFFLAYQPLFDSGDFRLTGYEALLRWEHPERGFVSPAEFIPVAEDIGLIAPLGAWVLRQACSDAAAWPRRVSVAVNLSAAQFDNGQLIGDVNDALAHSGLGADRLELEITESLLMSDVQRVTATLHQLRKIGARIAMDDFGTGYSSLAYLWRFPFDKLKIDRAFTESLVDDPKAGLIVNSVVSLAHALGIRVNAEGVETPGQCKALQDSGCNELQGFLLGRPTPNALLTHQDYAPPTDKPSSPPAPASVIGAVAAPTFPVSG